MRPRRGRHGLSGDFLDAGGNRLDRKPQRLAQLLAERSVDALGIEPHLATEEVIGIQVAE